MKDKVLKIALRSLGTVALAIGFVFMVGGAPFVNNPVDKDAEITPSADSPYVLLADPQVGTGALDAPNLPPPPGELTDGGDVNPSIGLFNARFAAADGSPGFATEEHEVSGACDDAGQRYVQVECPDCQVINGGANSEVLIWSENVDDKTVVRVVSRDCVRESSVGASVVATLRFEDDVVDFTSGVADLSVGRIPLLAGATRVSSINLGQWFATYDEVARPSTALLDMTLALRKWGWREVSSGNEPGPETFQGQRIFTNNVNATCVISLTRQDDVYQLLTVINSRA